MNKSYMQTTRYAPQFRRHLLILASAIVPLSSSFEVAAGILSSGEDHIQIFMWVAGQKANNKARAIANDHCGRYNKRAKFKSLEKNVYAYDCLPIQAVTPVQAVTPATPSTSLAQQRKALAMITDTADSICEEVPTEVQLRRLELSGNAKAEFNGLIKKFVDLEITGAGEYQRSDERRAVLEQDLAKAITDRSKCKTNVFNRLVDKFIPN